MKFFFDNSDDGKVELKVGCNETIADMKKEKVSKFEEKSTVDDELVSVTSTSGKIMHVKKKNLQKILSVKNILQLSKSHERKNVYRCVKCNVRFESKVALINHDKETHGGYINVKRIG